MGAVLRYDELVFHPALFFVMPAAGFFCTGNLMAMFIYVELVYNKKKRGVHAMHRSRKEGSFQARREAAA